MSVSAFAFTYTPTLKYSPSDNDKYFGTKKALNGAVEVLVFDNSARLQLYLAEYSDFVNSGLATKSLYTKTAAYSDGYAMIVKNVFEHTNTDLTGGGVCILKAEDGASCFYNVFSERTRTYAYSYSYRVESARANTSLELRNLNSTNGLLMAEDRPGFGGLWDCNTYFATYTSSFCSRQLPYETDDGTEQINKDFRYTGGDSVTVMQYVYDKSTNINEFGQTYIAPGKWTTETVILNGAVGTLASAGFALAALAFSF